MRTAIYIRVSTQEQAKEGFSIASQRQRLTQFAQSQDWDIIDYYVDEGISAKDTNRPELQRMLEDIREKKIDVVLVYRLDRLTRSVLDLYKLLDEFQKHDCAFKSATEVYDTTTAIGRLFITLVAALAQWERENTAERIKIGMEQMVSEGKWHGGTVAYGYEWKDGKLEIVPEEAEVVKTIFKKYLEGYGDNKLTVWLNERGYKTKKGYPWSHTSVGYLLTNPIYIGHLRWNYTSDGDYFTVEDVCEPIIDEGTFNDVQQLRKKRTDIHPRQATSTYVFSGILRCGRCGAALKGKKTKIKGMTYFHYMCTKKARGLCNLPRIEERLIEREFLKFVERFRGKEHALEVASDTKDEERSKQEEIKMLNKEIQVLKTRRKKWQHAYANDAITLEELKDLTQEDKHREQELRKRLEELYSDDIPHSDPRDIVNILQDFNAQWNVATREERKVLLQIIIKKITVDTPYNRMPPGRYDKRIVNIDIQFN